MSDAETPIPASDLPTRFAMGVVMIAVALTAVWLGGWPFRLLVAAAAAIMLVEWADMLKVERRWAYAGAVLVTAALLGAAEYLYPAGEQLLEFEGADLAPNWQGFGAIALAALLAGIASRRVALGAGVLFVGLPSFALISLSWVWETPVLWVMVVTWATDIFAYFAGRTIGGPKLAAGISPNKTWAGLGGGIAGAAAFGWLVATWFEMESFFLWSGAAMAVVAQAGDLFESWLKRRAGVKDSGSLLPGHGGVLDRLDGLLAVAVVTTLLLMAGVWTG